MQERRPSSPVIASTPRKYETIQCCQSPRNNDTKQMTRNPQPMCKRRVEREAKTRQSYEELRKTMCVEKAHRRTDALIQHQLYHNPPFLPGPAAISGFSETHRSMYFLTDPFRSALTCASEIPVYSANSSSYKAATESKFRLR